jgi:hypothetical protein
MLTVQSLQKKRQLNHIQQEAIRLFSSDPRIEIESIELCPLCGRENFYSVAIAHTTDSKLLETSRGKLVEVAKANGITLKQTFGLYPVWFTPTYWAPEVRPQA